MVVLAVEEDGSRVNASSERSKKMELVVPTTKDEDEDAPTGVLVGFENVVWEKDVDGTMDTMDRGAVPPPAPPPVVSFSNCTSMG